MSDHRPSTMRRDVISAYVLTFARIASWVVVSAVVYRKLGTAAFATVALVRSTVGILGYASLGIGPAIIRFLSVAEQKKSEPRPVATIDASNAGGSPPPMLAYETTPGPPPPDENVLTIYVTGERVALWLGGISLALAIAYGGVFERLHDVGNVGSVMQFVWAFGFGISLRMISEAPSALLQVRGRIAFDNLLTASAEIIWATIVAISVRESASVDSIGIAFLIANVILLAGRVLAGRSEAESMSSDSGRYSPTIQRALLSFGLLITLGQVADFLYSPIDYVLINRLIDADTVAIYAPAVHIDAGLLVLVTGLALVLLPKTALAHASGDIERVRRYYLRGTLATAGMLLVAAVAVWALSPWIFKLWLGNDMPATRAILPMVLIHTVVGGSSAVGRSILLGMGKVRAFTASVLVAGVSNVILSYIFVRHFDLGLRGIVLGTIVVVVARAGLWMPWYVWRSLKTNTVTDDAIAGVPPTEIP